MFFEGKSLELLLAAVVALVVVGPKDLPVLLRRLGQFMAKLRGMAAEFRASFDEMARQSELDELRKEVEALRRGQLTDAASQVSVHAETTQIVDEIHQGLADVGVQLHPPMSYQYVEAPSEPAAAPAAVEPPAQPAKAPRAKARPKASAAAKPAAKTAAKPRAKAAPAKASSVKSKPAKAKS